MGSNITTGDILTARYHSRRAIKFIESGLKHPGKPIWFLRGMTIFSDKRLIRDILDRKLRKDKRVVEYTITASFFVITQRKAI